VSKTRRLDDNKLLLSFSLEQKSSNLQTSFYYFTESQSSSMVNFDLTLHDDNMYDQ